MVLACEGMAQAKRTLLDEKKKSLFGLLRLKTKHVPIFRKKGCMFKVGDLCEVICMISMVTDDEAPQHPVLPVGSWVEVLEVCSHEKLKVVGRGKHGWIHLNGYGDQKVLKVVSKDKVTLSDYKVGCQFRLNAHVTASATERVDGPTVEEWSPGTAVEILEVCPPCRARVLNISQREGWITLVSESGKPFLDKTEEAKFFLSQGRAFMKAAQLGDLDALIKAASTEHSACSKAINVNCCDSFGRTALMQASAFGKTAIVKWLLEMPDIDVDAKDQRHRTALCHAAQVGSPEIVEALIEAGASVDACDDGGCTPLMCAVQGGHEPVLVALLTGKADITVVDLDGRTVLEYATMCKQEHLLHILMPLVPQHVLGSNAYKNNAERPLNASFRQESPAHKDVAEKPLNSSSKPGSPAQRDQLEKPLNASFRPESPAYKDVVEKPLNASSKPGSPAQRDQVEKPLNAGVVPRSPSKAKSKPVGTRGCLQQTGQGTLHTTAQTIVQSSPRSIGTPVDSPPGSPKRSPLESPRGGPKKRQEGLLATLEADSSLASAPLQAEKIQQESAPSDGEPWIARNSCPSKKPTPRKHGAGNEPWRERNSCPSHKKQPFQKPGGDKSLKPELLRSKKNLQESGKRHEGPESPRTDKPPKPDSQGKKKVHGIKNK